MSFWTLHPTDLGRDLRSPSRLRALFASAGAVAIALYDISQVPHYPSLSLRYLYAFTGLLWLYAFSDAKLGKSLGLRIPPKPSWHYWIKATLTLAGIGVAFFVLGQGALYLSGSERSLFWTFRSPVEFWEWWIKMTCVEIPPLEETLYRVVLAVPLLAFLGPWPALAISSGIFGALHFAYGIAGPENLFGGALLTWAFFRSESILVPLLLHISGSVVVGIFHRLLSSY